MFQVQLALAKAVAELDRLELRARGSSADPTFALELDAARHKTATAAIYLVGAAGARKRLLPADAVAMLDALVGRGLFTWPVEPADEPFEPWSGDDADPDEQR